VLTDREAAVTSLVLGAVVGLFLFAFFVWAVIHDDQKEPLLTLGAGLLTALPWVAIGWRRAMMATARLTPTTLVFRTWFRTRRPHWGDMAGVTMAAMNRHGAIQLTPAVEMRDGRTRHLVGFRALPNRGSGVQHVVDMLERARLEYS
jgi:hypothetical protein